MRFSDWVWKCPWMQSCRVFYWRVRRGWLSGWDDWLVINWIGFWLEPLDDGDYVSGIGVREVFLDRMFSRFSQSNRTNI